MSSKLQIIVDISGSMCEMAKISISMNLLSTIREFNNFNQTFDEVSLFFWNEINFMKIEDFMQFEASGKLNFEKLKEHLLLYSKNDGDIKVLLLSDGNYSNNEFDNFSNYTQESSQICIVPILIGADSSTDKLKTIAWNEHIYLAEDVLTAFKSLADISNNQYFFQLRCIQDILNISVKEKEDIVDEW